MGRQAGLRAVRAAIDYSPNSLQHRRQTDAASKRPDVFDDVDELLVAQDAVLAKGRHDDIRILYGRIPYLARDLFLARKTGWMATNAGPMAPGESPPGIM